MKLSFFHNINTKLCYAGCICLIAASALCGTGTASKSSDNSIQIGMDSIMVCDSITDQSGIKVTASFSATFPSSFKNSKKEAGKLLSTINSAIFNTNHANLKFRHPFGGQSHLSQFRLFVHGEELNHKQGLQAVVGF